MNLAVTRVRLAEMLFGIGLALVIVSAVLIARTFIESSEAPVPVQSTNPAPVLGLDDKSISKQATASNGIRRFMASPFVS